MSTIRIAATLAVVALMTGACTRESGPAGGTATVQDRADTIYVGGDVVTVDDAMPSAEALAVREGRILAVGPRAEIERLRGDRTKTVDLAGKALLPGFIDPHSHYFSALSVANQANVYAPPAGPAKDVASIVAALVQFRDAKQVPKGELIQAYGYDENVMPEGRYLNRDDLDAAFPDHPVMVGHVSMHGAVMNSLALAKYGITKDTETPPGGVIVRKPGTNEPYGLIMETAYMGVFGQLPRPTPEQEVANTKAAHLLYARHGITTAHEGATHAPELEVMKRAAAAGAHLIDVVAFPFITELDPILAKHPAETWGRYENGLKIGGVKITGDGSPQGRTAYFTTPYLAGGPGGENDWRGSPTFLGDTLEQMVARVHGMKVPLNFHANGDAAIDLLIGAVGKATGGKGDPAWNVTMIHGQFTRQDQIPKLKELGIRPSFYTLHTYYFAEAHSANRGPEQTAYISPLRDAIDAGLRPTNHTDFVVAPLDQPFVLWSAVNRISRAGNEIGPGQRVTPLEALKAMTIWAAEQYGEQDSKGSLTPGKRADLVILDRNPLAVPPAELKDLQIVETIKDGTTVYARP
jgi:predicted amidohydrolase YtcJ